MQCRSFSRNRFQHACILRPCTTTRRIDEKFAISSLAPGELRSQTNAIYNVLLWIPLHASPSCSLCDRGRLVPATSPCVIFLHTRNNTFGEWERSMHFYQDIYPHNNNNSSSMSWLPYLSLYMSSLAGLLKGFQLWLF